MIQQALGYFFIIVASTLGFITAYSQTDIVTERNSAARHDLNPTTRELPGLILICAVLIAVRIANAGFRPAGSNSQLYWVFVNLQIIILIYSNFLLTNVRAFVTVQLLGAVIFGTSGMMNWFSWVFFIASGLLVYGERWWFGKHFKPGSFTYLLPPMVIGVAFWVMAAIRFAGSITPEFAFVNAFSFCWAYFALDRYDRDLHMNQHVIAKLTHETQFDGLTQVRNWSTFQDDFNSLFARNKGRADSNLALITFDIDHFKEINDTYGHLVGNQALMMISTTLSKYLLEQKLRGKIYRTGGEEFAILLPRTDLPTATRIVLGCQRQLRHSQVRYSAGEFYLSASFGLTMAAKDKYPDTTAMFKMADHYLYQSKHRGRNCVTVEGKTMTAMN